MQIIVICTISPFIHKNTVPTASVLRAEGASHLPCTNLHPPPGHPEVSHKCSPGVIASRQRRIQWASQSWLCRADLPHARPALGSPGHLAQAGPRLPSTAPQPGDCRQVWGGGTHVRPFWMGSRKPSTHGSELPKSFRPLGLPADWRGQVLARPLFILPEIIPVGTLRP